MRRIWSKPFYVWAGSLACGATLVVFSLCNPWPLVGNPSAGIIWENASSLPDKHGFAGPFAGSIDGTLYVAGGANFQAGYPWEGGKKVWHDRIFVLPVQARQWEVLDAWLPKPLAYGVSASLPTMGMIVMAGGSGQANQPVQNSYCLMAVPGGIRTSSLPPLPVPLAESSGLAVGNVVYVFSGRTSGGTSRKAFRLDLGQNPFSWEELPWPSGARGRMHSVAGYQGGKVYLFGGRDFQGECGLQHPEDRLEAEKLDFLRDAYCLDLSSLEWSRIADLPRGMSAAPYVAVPEGLHSLIVIGGVDPDFVERQMDARPALNGQGHAHPGFPRAIWSYDTLADTWCKAGELPPGYDMPVTAPVILLSSGEFVIPSGEIKPGVRTTQVLKGTVSRK